MRCIKTVSPRRDNSSKMTYDPSPAPSAIPGILHVQIRPDFIPGGKVAICNSKQIVRWCHEEIDAIGATLNSFPLCF